MSNGSFKSSRMHRAGRFVFLAIGAFVLAIAAQTACAQVRRGTDDDIRFAGYAAADDGNGGENFIRFPPPITVGALSSHIISATFFDSDYSLEYALTDQLILSSVQTATGTLHQLAQLTIQLGAKASIAADPVSGQLHGVESDAACDHSILVTIDRNTGGTSVIRDFAPCSQSLAIDAQELLYSIDRDTDAVQVFDGTTLTELDALGIATNETSALAVVPDTGALLLFQFETSNVMYTVDKSSGSATLVGSIGGGTPLLAVALAPDDIFSDGFGE
jgi:hypothetical protein